MENEKKRNQLMSDSIYGDDDKRTRSDVKNALIKKQEDMKKGPGLVNDTDGSEQKKKKKLDHSTS